MEVNGKWGFINSGGNIVIKPTFNEVFEFHEGIGLVRTGAIVDTAKAAFFGLAGRWKYIDPKGRIVIEKPEGGYFSEGIAPVCVQGKWKVLPGDGTITFELEKFGGINKKGEMIIPAKYGFLDYFSEGLAVFSQEPLGLDPNAKYGYLDPTGAVVIEPVYESACAFSEGLALVSVSGKMRFINGVGETVFPPQYEGAQSFREGLAAATKNGEWGYIDKLGRFVIPPKFNIAEQFSEGYAAVIVQGKIGYINTKGDYAIKPRFEDFPVWDTRPPTTRSLFVLFFGRLGASYGKKPKMGIYKCEGRVCDSTEI